MLNNRQNRNPWLTDFCDSLRIFVSIVMIQIVVIIYALSFLSFDMEFLRKLSILTLLAHLNGLVILILLCKLRSILNSFRVIEGVLLVVILVIIWTTFISQVIGYLDMQLTFHLLKNQGAINYLNIKLSVSSVIICLALTRYFYIQDQWHKHVQKLSDSRLNALQARIKPHFLFNSLNSIASLISVDPDRAELAIATFSELMRRTFTHKDKWITIAQEIEWVEQYLAIEKLRLDQRLSFEINCESGLEGLKIPVLCLQPLVENAILHGIQPLELGGHVDIALFKQNDKLIIQVTNPFIPTKSHQSNGMAMENIAERLKLQYGHKTQMQINAENSKYQVRLVIPL